VARCGGEAGVDMEGTNTGEVGFNGRVSEPAIGEEGNPLGEGGRGGGEKTTGLGLEGWINCDKIQEGSLPCCVGFSSTGGEAVPEVKGGSTREVSMRLIPVIRDFVDEEIFSSVGSNWKSLEY
jgi:hypothetical protein